MSPVSPDEREAVLPVHGFVLAGGKSSRMGEDKALLPFHGRPMVEIAVEKLRSFCAQVCIAGNRDDLSGFASAVLEKRSDAGPAAGIEAGLMACGQPWALFMPVDVPLAPTGLLRRWAEAVVAREGCRTSYLVVNGTSQPAFCMLRRTCAERISSALDGGERRVARLLVVAAEAEGLWRCDAAQFSPAGSADELERRFANLNTPDELAEASAWPLHPNG